MTALMGIPASGKSTLVESIPNTEVICPDEIRRELTGDRGDQSRNDLVFNTAHERLFNALHEGRDVLFDATNVTASARKALLDIADDAGAETRLIVIRTPFEECKMRNLARVRHQVPAHVMDLMHERFTRSLSEIGYERWDQIVNRWQW
jgi:predicted kinase